MPLRSVPGHDPMEIEQNYPSTPNSLFDIRVNVVSDRRTDINMSPASLPSAEEYELFVVDNIAITGFMYVHVVVNLFKDFTGFGVLIWVGAPVLTIGGQH